MLFRPKMTVPLMLFVGLLWAGTSTPAQATTARVLRVAATTEGFSPADLTKLDRALMLVERVLNSEEFHRKVLGFEWRAQRRFAENQGLTNEAILARIFDAEEHSRPGRNGTLDLKLQLVRSRNPWSRVPGWTRPGDDTIWLNSRFFRRSDWTAADVAGNLVHEWLHQLGFTHPYQATPDRPFTVPYAVGEIVSDLLSPS
jgi:hypothetical protein